MESTLIGCLTLHDTVSDTTFVSEEYTETAQKERLAHETPLTCR